MSSVGNNIKLSRLSYGNLGSVSLFKITAALTHPHMRIGKAVASI